MFSFPQIVYLITKSLTLFHRIENNIINNRPNKYSIFILFVHENELIRPSGRSRTLSNSSEPRKYFTAEEKMSDKLRGNIANSFQSYTCTLSGASNKNKGDRA